MTTKWDIVTRAQNRVKDYPSALGSAVVVNYVEDMANYMEQFTDQTINLNDVGSKWQGPLTNGTAAMMLGYMNGVGVSYNAGRLSIDKDTELKGQVAQMAFMIKQMDNELNMIGKKIEFDKSEP